MTVSSTIVEDIEDVSHLPSESRGVRCGPKAACIPPSEADREPVDADTKRTVPGVQTIWVKTFGCSHNQSDSEYMMGILQAYGYQYELPLLCVAPCDHRFFASAYYDGKHIT
jgi:threonylcarbamoyladenosine tRNA methylthiotransferase CDKAL1